MEDPIVDMHDIEVGRQAIGRPLRGLADGCLPGVPSASAPRSFVRLRAPTTTASGRDGVVCIALLLDL